MEAPKKILAVLIVVGLVFQYVTMLQTFVPVVGYYVPAILYAIVAVWLFISD